MKRTKEKLALKKNDQPEVADIFRLYGESYPFTDKKLLKFKMLDFTVSFFEK